MTLTIRKEILSLNFLKKLALIALFLPALPAMAQTGSIGGSIKTADGQAAEYVNVIIKGTSRGTATSKDGSYQLKNIRPGKYIVTASLIGLEKQEQTAEVKAGEKTVIDFLLKENASRLQEVVISGRSLNKTTSQVAKMPLKKLENPQVYSTVPADLLKEQGITNFDDAMRNVPGIARTWESTGRIGDGASYFALRGFEAQPSLYNGLPGFTSGDLDPADIEEIQVIKGPSGTLFGANFYGYGGIINTVTKQPYFNTGGEITYNAGSFGLNRISADINTPLSQTEKIALRVNTSYHSENSFQDAGFKKSFFIAPSLAYEANEKLSFNFMAEILEEERAVAPVFFHSNRFDPLTFNTVEALGLDTYQSFTSNDLTMKNPRYNMQGQMTFRISDAWTSQTALSKGNSKSLGYYGYIFGNDPGSNEFTQYIHKENQVNSTVDIQQNFNGDFKTGSIRNRLLIGLDYFNQNTVDNGTGYGFMRNVTPQGDIIYPDPAHPVYATQESVDSLLVGTGMSHSNVSNSSYSIYASDVFNFSPALSLMASLRGDYFVSDGEKTDTGDDFKQFVLSPKFGLVYQPVQDKVSLFANYLNTFLNVAPFQVTDASGNNPHIKSFKPEHANQWEAGVKTNLWDDKLTATVSYYHIKVTNRVTPQVSNPNDYDQRGQVGSKGFELDLGANPAPGLSLIAGYSHNVTKVLAGDGADFYSEKGRSPGGQGPGEQANLWLTYKFMQGKLKDFGFGTGGNYAGEYKVINNSVVGEFNLPAYALLNASLFYNGDRFRVTLNGNNLTDKKYYIGYWSINPQRPVNFAASFAYKF